MTPRLRPNPFSSSSSVFHISRGLAAASQTVPHGEMTEPVGF
eukprot:CAMPEP_0172510820 /NCGR_PEP_ID=MMETSP1066-20121228/231695_1 /TAXON_ID=671091 /ORGANISM="Coscinodiscus wailesii, Strain CCMP2513" /LENGTH=41 /DNA_ID= /DNA_START= /DNA_END= /DNA_ORIENTATION=